MVERRCSYRWCDQAEHASKRSAQEKGYHLDRLWYCSQRCTALQIGSDLRKMNSSRDRRIACFPRPRMGLFLIRSGLITSQQLQMAFEAQQKSKAGRIGDWLCQMGFVTERDIAIAIGKQYRAPYVDLSNPQINKDVLPVLPAPFVLRFKVFPLDFVGHKRELSIAFGGPVDFVVVNALRKVLDCTVYPYVGDESLVRDLIDKYYGRLAEELEADDDVEAPLVNDSDIEAIANFVLMEANKLLTTDIIIEACRNQLWIRLLVADQFEDRFINLSKLADPKEKVG